MRIQQISVFLENKAGRLASVTRTLGDNDIDIRALSIADTRDFGVLRLIVNKPVKAERILKEKGFTVSGTSVIAIGVPNRPGGLADALEILGGAAIGIEYVYAFVGRVEDEALVILKVDDPDAAVGALTARGIKVLPAGAVYDKE